MDRDRSDKLCKLTTKLNTLVRAADALKQKSGGAILVQDEHNNEIYLDEIEGMKNGMLETLDHQIKCVTNDIKNEAAGN